MKNALLTLCTLLTFGLCTIAQNVALTGSRPGGMRFTENKGQWHHNFLFRTEIPGGNVRLEKNAFYFFLYSQEDLAKIQHPSKGPKGVLHGHSIHEQFIGANPSPEVSGNNVYADYANFYIGKDPAYWASHVGIYGKVVYHNLYDGVDMQVYGSTEHQVKYDLLVSPGKDVEQIKIKYEGADRIRIKEERLHIGTSIGDVIEQKPFAYQETEEGRIPVKCLFVIKDGLVQFEFPDGYDKHLPLVIDPSVVFATYTGSTADNWGYTATYDDQGNMYLGGYVNVDQFGATTNYPTTAGAFQVNWGGGTGTISGNPYPQDGGNGIGYACDMGITKFNSTGTQLIYSTYLGGSDNETPNSLVVDAQGNLIIYGVTYSTDYPVTSGAYSTSYSGGGDIVVTKLNPSGTALVGSTFIGGSQNDGINFDPHEENPGNLKRNYGDQNRGEVNIDANGDIYVASCTRSTDFPVTAGALQGTLGGTQDGCAFKLNGACTQLLWSTYLGGNKDDACYSLDIGPAGTIYVGGGTMSGDFHTTTGSLHTAYQGGQYDGFLAHISADGRQLLSSTYIGTSGDDQVYAVKLDMSNNVYIVGQSSGSYPVLNAAYSNPNSGQFIVKLNPDLNSVFYSTVFGNGNGLPNISPTAFLVDTCENVYVAGWGCQSQSVFCASFAFPPNEMRNMPLTNDAYQQTTDGNDFYFFVLSRDAGNILYGSYFGGRGNGVNTGIEHVDGGTSRFDRRGVVYEAICAGCGGNSLTPTTSGVWSPHNASQNCNELGLKMEFNQIIPTVNVQAYPRATGCVPLTVQFNSVTSNASSFNWDFGDNTQSTQQNPVHVYNDTGTYIIKLVGINTCHLADTAYTTVWVRDDSITANFFPSVNIVCDSNKVSLAASGFATTSYLWNFGDNTTDTSAQTSHTYQTAGTYNIGLIVTDTTKCNLRDTFATQVNIPPLIHAGFTLSSYKGCVPLLVNFNAPSVNTPFTTYRWSLGDGDSSGVRSFSHTYTVADSFLVRLIVFDSTSCNVADTAYAWVVTIDSFSNADFQFTRTFFGCDSVQLTAWTTYHGSSSQTWDFGDGTVFSNVDSVRHTYTTSGLFTLTHILNDVRMVCKPSDTAQISLGLSPLNIAIAIPGTGGCVPFTATFMGSSGLMSTSYLWNFGDGTFGQGDTVSHTYTFVGNFNVVVLGHDTNACVQGDSAYARIGVIDDSVHADFLMSVLRHCDSNLVIDLINTSTNATNYFWTFGDGTSSTQKDEGHTYTQPATYVVTLIVEDTTRCHPVDTISKPVTLKPNAVVDFTAGDVCFGTPIQFNNEGNPLASYRWSFGDNHNSNLYSPLHTFSVTGTYSVQLIITDTTTCNIKDTATHQVQVYAQPVAGFEIAGDTFKFETPVVFTSTSLYYDHLLWNLGDGTTSMDETALAHVYHSLGVMNICVTAWNEICADTMCKNIFISFTPLIGVPNAFSPNGDGINDIVKVEGKGITAITFTIYNRWGEKVFETNNPNEGWDGIYKGVLQEMDAYTYAVDATFINGKTAQLKGNITLLR